MRVLTGDPKGDDKKSGMRTSRRLSRDAETGDSFRSRMKAKEDVAAGDFMARPMTFDLNEERDFLESLRGDGIGPGVVDFEIGNLYTQQTQYDKDMRRFNDQVEERQIALTAAENDLARAFSTDRFGMPINLNWSEDSTVTSGFLKETEPHISKFIDQMFQDVGAAPGRGKQTGLGLDKDGKVKEGLPWSAVTIYRLAVPYYGKNTFPKSDSHADYIGAAFKGEGPLKASELDDIDDFNPQMGQILFRGRKSKKHGDTTKWSFNKFKRKAGRFYPSHGDIVTDTGVDQGGRFVVVSGGNVGDTFIRKKIYLNDLKDAGYKGVIHDDSNEPYN